MLLLRIMTIILRIYTIFWVIYHLTDSEKLMTSFSIVTFLVSVLFLNHMNLGLYGKYSIIIVPLLMSILIYRKTVLLAIFGFALAQIFYVFAVSGSLVLTYYLNMFINQPMILNSSIAPYILIGGIYLLAFIIKKKIITFLKLISSFKKQLFLPVVFLLILVLVTADTFQWMTFPTRKVAIVHNFLYSGIGIILVVSFFYVKVMREKAARIKKVNTNLMEKIIELRKFKHDYGSEISGLYGLYKLGEYKKLEKMLKDIIKRYETIEGNAEINSEASVIVKSLFSSIINPKMTIEIKDEGYYGNITLSEPELYRILSNIIKNAVEALKGIEDSRLKYRSYNGYKMLVIEVANIGEAIPQITEKTLENIYKPGYSTKGTKEERGYGLAIVKELMDKAGGKIFVESKKNSTVFRLEIPRRE